MAGRFWSKPVALGCGSRAQMRSKQLPHPVPAPHARPTSPSLRAPAAITSDNSRSVTAWQMQTYTALLDFLPGTARYLLGEPNLIMTP